MVPIKATILYRLAVIVLAVGTLVSCQSLPQRIAAPDQSTVDKLISDWKAKPQQWHAR